jgi:hypothetical protein
MAKGQRRSNREIRKPKKSVEKPGTALPPRNPMKIAVKREA